MIPTNDKSRVPARGSSRGAARHGLTALEFVGCTIAVVGGAWLGALYLGVDVRHLAHTALAEAELLDNVPRKWRPPAPKEKPMPREQLVELLREELGAVRSELASLRTGDAAQTAGGSAKPAIARSNSSAPQASKDQTLAYWQRISDIALHEAALQHDAESVANQKNAANVFAVKARIRRFAARSVEAVPSDGVDNLVLQFGRHLAVWYENGGELYERAVLIWEAPVDGQSREQLNQEWRRADLHHRNEAKLLSDKATAVRSTASRQFEVAFPEFAKAVSAAATPEATVQ